MAHQVGNRPVKVPAKGDAKNTGSPGPTPAPTSAELALKRDTSMGRTSYGANAWDGRTAADPGKSVSSPLADQLRAKNGEADGDLLGRIIERGSSRAVVADVDLQSPQTRQVDATPLPTTHGMKGATAGPKVPTKLG
jgi:hypothetical protein